MLRTALPLVLLFGSFTACSSDPDVQPSDAGTDASSSGGGSSGTSSSSSSSSSSGDSAAPPALPAGFTEVPYLSTEPKRKFAQAEQVLQANQDYIAVLETDAGRIVLDLYEVETPITVNSFVFLALNHFYEQIAFHRVIDGFMAQTGDPNSVAGKPTTWGRGGAGYTFGVEVQPSLTFDGPGVLGMARSSSPTSNGSQFFITFSAQSSLDQEYTVWGKVLEGLDVLPAIVRGEPPTTPTRITRVQIAIKPR